jgi:1-acyl-sn-glycerol-3-phosphate acyltransferase
MHTCSRLLLHRQSLVLFPEGTRSKTGEIARFKPGVGMLSVTNNVPVVPTRIAGLETSGIAYRVDRDFARRGFRKPPTGKARVSVHFGEPLYPADFSSGRRGYVEIAKAAEACVKSLAS